VSKKWERGLSDEQRRRLAEIDAALVPLRQERNKIRNAACQRTRYWDSKEARTSKAMRRINERITYRSDDASLS
jgi:hypothetical protein